MKAVQLVHQGVLIAALPLYVETICKQSSVEPFITVRGLETVTRVG